MHLEMIAASSGEMWIMVFFLLIGIGFLLFGRKGELIFAGVIALASVTSIAYSNHIQYIGDRFLMEQFHQGNALVCGMWRGESARVDPLKGWKYEEGVGFVKGDVIINDPSVCSVIGRAFPEPSSVPYWFAFVSVMGILIILRAVIMGSGEEQQEIQQAIHQETPNGK